MRGLKKIHKGGKRAQCSPTVLAAAGLVDGCWDSDCGDGVRGGSHSFLLSPFLLDTRDSWSVRRKVVQNFPVETNVPVQEPKYYCWMVQRPQSDPAGPDKELHSISTVNLFNSYTRHPVVSKYESIYFRLLFWLIAR